MPVGAGPAAAARLVVERATRADVLYLGEMHDNPHHHAGQVVVLRALTARGARPAVAFEMLPEGDQALVDQALDGAAGPDEVERRLRWRERGWPDFALYWPLFEEARRHALPIIAADLAPATTRLVARSGLAAVPADGGRLASVLPPDPAREAAIARTIRTAHCDLLPASRIPAMVEAWHARNVTMARRLRAVLDARSARHGATGPGVVVIAGAGHQAPGGLPDQLAVLRPETRQLVVEFREAGAEPPDVAVAPAGPPGEADVVWLTPALARPDPCAALRRPSG